MSTPRISIIMAAYNAASFIHEAVMSVILQSYANWELLIINDGSTDETEEVVTKIQDSRILYFKQNNAGVSSARNQGLINMSGEYFCFLDADDSLPPNSLELRISKFEQSPNLTFVDGIVSIRDQTMKSETGRFAPKCSGYVFDRLVRLDSCCFFGPSWMIKREPDRLYRMPEGLTHAEDLCFYLSLAEDRLYDHVDEPVYWYRKGHASAMKNVIGLERGYRYYYSFAKSLGASERDLKYLKKRVRRILFLSYLFDANSPWNAARALFGKFT